MMRSIIKKLFYKIFSGVSLPIFNNQLKGLRLKISPLLPPLHLFREIERENHYAYDTFIKPGNIIFDIGANVGLHTYYFATKFRDTYVCSFEPLKANAEYIEGIISLNKLGNIKVIKKAVGAETGLVFFDTYKNNHQGKIAKAPSDLRVEIITLDDFIKHENIKPDFIKIDVEGAESEVLAGFVNLVNEVKPVIIIELHTNDQSKQVAEFFRRLDYKIFRATFIDNWKRNKRFLRIDNESKNGDTPSGFWGTVVAVPGSKVESFSLITEECLV